MPFEKSGDYELALCVDLPGLLSDGVIDIADGDHGFAKAGDSAVVNFARVDIDKATVPNDEVGFALRSGGFQDFVVHMLFFLEEIYKINRMLLYLR